VRGRSLFVRDPVPVVRDRLPGPARGEEACRRKVAEQVATADCVFVDGTFWSDDEMSCQGAGSRTWQPMGHLPVGGADGSARTLPTKRKIYPDINNTNPILDEESQERRRLTDSGIEVGRAGLEVEV
jgi:pyrroloquinoline quinone biosynthesis protein B